MYNGQAAVEAVRTDAGKYTFICMGESAVVLEGSLVYVVASTDTHALEKHGLWVFVFPLNFAFFLHAFFARSLSLLLPHPFLSVIVYIFNNHTYWMVGPLTP